MTEDYPAVTQYRMFLAKSHFNLGNLLARAGKPAEAETEYREALALFRKLADDSPTVTEFRQGLVSARAALHHMAHFRLRMLDLAMPADPFAPAR